MKAVNQRHHKIFGNYLTDFKEKKADRPYSYTVINVIDKILSQTLIEQIEAGLLQSFEEEGLRGFYREVTEELFGQIFKDKSYLEHDRRYYKFLQNYFENLKSDRRNTQIEYRAYLDYRFAGDLDDFFQEFLPHLQVSILSVLWSFTQRGPLPPWRYHSRNIQGYDYLNRTQAFQKLAQANQHYSSVLEVLENNIDKAFYFDPKMSKEKGNTPDGRMEIFTFEMIRRNVHRDIIRVEST